MEKPKKKIRNPLKCSVCGKFIAYSDKEVDVKFTPDSEFMMEETEFTHKKCNNNEMGKL